jgi:peroxiredoxin
MRLLSSLLLAGLLLLPAMAADVPRPAAEIKFIDHTGRSVQLSALKGKVVVIEYLLTTCPTCQANARLLSRLQTELGPQGLVVLGIAIDEGAGQRLTQFIQRTGANFSLGIQKDTAAREWLQFPVMVRMTMPQLAFVDRKGVVREQHGAIEPWMAEAVEETNIRALLKKLLAEPAGIAAKPAAKK